MEFVLPTILLFLYVWAIIFGYIASIFLMPFIAMNVIKTFMDSDKLAFCALVAPTIFAYTLFLSSRGVNLFFAVVIGVLIVAVSFMAGYTILTWQPSEHRSQS